MLVDDLSYTYAEEESGGSPNRLVSISDAAGNNYSWDAGGGAFEHDEAGRMLKAPAPTGLQAASYNAEGLPEAMALSGGSALTYRYTAGGQRTYKKQEGQGATYYVRDGRATLAVVEGSALKYWNILKPGGEAVGRQISGGSTRLYVKDHLGSIRAVVDPSGYGSVVEERDYYPFGLPMPGRYDKGSPPTKEDFTGYEKDTETSLHYAGARYYSAAFGRWTTTDPILGEKEPKALLKQDQRLLTMTSYNYAFANPVRLMDPTGLAPLDCPPCDGATKAEIRGNLIENGEMPEMKMSEEEFYAKAADTYAKIFTALGAGSALGAAGAGASGLYTAAQGLLQAATAADLVSTGARVIDFWETKKGTAEYARKRKEARVQGIKFGLNAVGLVGTRFLRTSLITRTSTEVTGPLFRSPNTGQFVSNMFGFGVRVASDATSVGVGLAPVKDIIYKDKQQKNK